LSNNSLLPPADVSLVICKQTILLFIIATKLVSLHQNVDRVFYTIVY